MARWQDGKMIEWRPSVVSVNSTVRDAIENLNATSIQIVLVVDDQLRLVGVIVDGDIRRGILRGTTLNDNATEVMQRKPISVSPEVNQVDAHLKMQMMSVLHLPVVDGNGHLCGLHMFNEFVVQTAHNNLFVIMAGGFGRRMGTLTSRTPKPMLSIAGKPILEHVIIRARNSGFRKFVITIHYLGEVIENYFGDGSKFGVSIEYVRETEPLGTAGAMRLISPVPSDPFLVSNADLLSNIDFAALLDFHISQPAEVTMAIRTHQWQNPFGVVEIEDGVVNKIVEKPIVSSSISAGIYVLNPTAIQSLNKNEYCDMPTLLQRLIAEKRRIVAFPVHEEWIDIGHENELDSEQLLR